jgi:hypothetical protein
MHQNYYDIRDRIVEKPTWFDEHSVPRYLDFSPDRVANIYADRVALVLISCQQCGHKFKVAFSESDTQRWKENHSKGPKGHLYTQIEYLKINIETRALSYKDPPNIACCPAGPTMTSLSLEVLEFWERNLVPGKSYVWVRNHEYEVKLEDYDANS